MENLKDVTQEDVSRLTKAMKSKDFRGHMDEYCREVSDPGHRKEYLQYLDQLEAKGEMPEGQQLLRCQPGCCVKTWISFKNGQTQKCFINIVHTERIEDVSMERSDAGDGHQVKLPYSLSPPRPDRDHNDEYCMTCDFAVSSRTFYQAMQHPNYMKMLVDTAAENLASHHLKGNEEVKRDYKVMTKLQCKGGFPMPMSVRAELLKDKGSKPTTPKVKAGAPDAVTPAELRQMRKEAKRATQTEQPEEERQPPPPPKAPEEKAPAAPRIRVPVHRLVHSGTIDLADYMESEQISCSRATIPKLLKLVVEVPTVKRVGDINLEVTSGNVVVEVPEKYYLDLPLPYEVEDEKGAAKFDKTKQVLTLELPVVPKPQEPKQDFQPSWKSATGDGDGAVSDGEEEPAGGDLLREEGQGADVVAGDPAPTLPPSAEPEGPVPGPLRAADERQAELLDVDPRGGALQVATVAQQEEGVAAGANVPAFVAASGFEGCRPGYYFGTGGEGLGYYLDNRQPAPGAPPPAERLEVLLPGARLPGRQEPSLAPIEPLVTVVAEDATGGAAASAPAGPQASEKPRAAPARQLPAHVQAYVDSTARLVARSAEPSAVSAEEPSVEWRQNAQNLTLLVDVPAGLEVTDLHLSVRGQRLLLAFCSRAPAADDATVRRWQLRGHLCGMVDARQWHVDPPVRSGEPLVLVLRKVDRGPWPSIFDAKVLATQPEAPEPARLEEPSVEVFKAVDESAVATGARHEDVGERDVGCLEEDDSAELDAAAAPEVASVKAIAEASLSKGPATEASIKSAMVMGQGVLLRNRLIFELF